MIALFVEDDSIYKALLTAANCYDRQRDARTYDGRDPVIAHPPCQLWGAMARINFARWGGEHNRPGNDGGLFKFALDLVHRNGGVLEHPAKSRAWDAFKLSRPRQAGWQLTADGGWVCEVWQSAYGHKANKATWLYYRGGAAPPELRWDRPRGTHQVGFHDQRGKQKKTSQHCQKEKQTQHHMILLWH